MDIIEDVARQLADSAPRTDRREQMYRNVDNGKARRRGLRDKHVTTVAQDRLVAARREAENTLAAHRGEDWAEAVILSMDKAHASGLTEQMRREAAFPEWAQVSDDDEIAPSVTLGGPSRLLDGIRDARAMREQALATYRERIRLARKAGCTMAEIGAAAGISRQAVSQILA